MTSRRAISLLRIALALLVLSIATVGRAPTAHCHCHDRAGTSAPDKPCPFGALRGLAAVLLDCTPVPALAASLATLDLRTELPPYESMRREPARVAARSRSPPFGRPVV